MARPYPVVGIAAELAYRRWRGAYQTHVAEPAVDEEELLVPVVHVLDRGVVTLALGCGRVNDGLALLACGQTVCYVLHADEKTDGKALARQFLGSRHGPESVCEIVVFDGREALYGIVSAMVVREQQPFGRNKLAGAAAAEEYDGVLERGLVYVVDVFGCQSEPFRAHLLDA